MKLTDKQKEGLREAVGQQLNMVRGEHPDTQAALISIWLIGILENQERVLKSLKEEG